MKVFYLHGHFTLANPYYICYIESQIAFNKHKNLLSIFIIKVSNVLTRVIEYVKPY